MTHPVKPVWSRPISDLKNATFWSKKVIVRNRRSIFKIVLRLSSKVFKEGWTLKPAVVYKSTKMGGDNSEKIYLAQKIYACDVILVTFYSYSDVIKAPSHAILLKLLFLKWPTFI